MGNDKTVSKKLTIVMYHRVLDIENSRYPRLKGMSPAEFRQQMDFFRDNYSVVTMEQVMGAIETGDHWRLPGNPLLLTFDDGYMDHYANVFPMLEEYGFQGSFFVSGKTFCEHKVLDVNKVHYILAAGDIDEVIRDLRERLDYYRNGGGHGPMSNESFAYLSNEELWNQWAKANRFDDEKTIFVKRVLQTAIPEKARNLISSELFEKYVGLSEDKFARELYMNADQIRTMKRHGMFIGIHGYDHYWLGNLPENEMKADISKALEVMGEFIDRRRWVMNYPYGSYNQPVCDFAKVSGTILGLSTEVRIADLDKDDPMALPRLDCVDFPPRV